jgi:hypoxanthine phosphoribosyltransferase
MNTVKIKDKEFAVNISAGEIQGFVQQVADQINRDLSDDNPLFVIILNGCFMFAGDLFKKVNFPCEISFIKLASYIGTESTSDVKTLIGINENIRGRKIVIVEDIIDTGITIDHLLIQLNKFQPAEIKVATLLFKPKAFQKNFNIDYIGKEIPNDFIIGYGLDYDGYGRNLPDIYKIVS